MDRSHSWSVLGPGALLRSMSPASGNPPGAPLGTAHSMLPVLHAAGAWSGLPGTQPRASPSQQHPTPGSPHPTGNPADTNDQHRAFLASHYPPGAGGNPLPPNAGGNPLPTNAGANPPPTTTRPATPQSDNSHPTRSSSPSRSSGSVHAAEMQGPLQEGNAAMVARARRAQRQQRADTEEGAPGLEGDRDDGDGDAAAPQTAPAGGDLEAAMDLLDADAGLQGDPDSEHKGMTVLLLANMHRHHPDRQERSVPCANLRNITVFRPGPGPLLGTSDWQHFGLRATWRRPWTSWTPTPACTTPNPRLLGQDTW